MLSIHKLSLVGGTICKRTCEESGTIGGRKEKELVDDDLTTGKYPTISLTVKTYETKRLRVTAAHLPPHSNCPHTPAYPPSHSTSTEGNVVL